MSRWTWLGLSLVIGLAACGDDEVASESDDGSSSSAGTGPGTTGATTSTTGVDASTSTTDDSASTTTGDTPPPTEFARGIRLERLTANQGVQVELVRDGVARPVGTYPIRMIRGRRTLIRGFWSLHAEFEARELIGRLTVDYPDGTTLEQDFTQMVESEGNDSAAASFQWLLEPDDVIPGMQIRAKVLEPDPATAPGEVSDPPPIVPLAGPTELVVNDIDMELEVVIVPLLHQFDGCEQAPPITEADVEAMQEEMEENNPVQRAIVTLREPLPYTESISANENCASETPENCGFTPINAVLSQAKTDDGAGAHVYYYGVIDSCDGFPGGLLGQAFGIPDAPVDVADVPTSSSQRVSSGRWFGSGEAAAETFVHEVGHSQSRYHIRCSGGEAGADSSYPHLGGRIGAWGFGIYDFELRGPTVGRDYMTYCSNAFVSDFGWELTYEVISLLTEHGATAAALPPTGETRVLTGVIDGGFEQWWIETAAAPRATPGDTLRVTTADVPVEVPAYVNAIPHSRDGRYVRVALPMSLAGVSALEVHAGTDVFAIDPAAIVRR